MDKDRKTLGFPLGPRSRLIVIGGDVDLQFLSNRLQSLGGPPNRNGKGPERAARKDPRRLGPRLDSFTHAYRTSVRFSPVAQANAQHALHGSHSSGVKPFSAPRSANTSNACVKLRPRDTSQIATDTIDYV